ncbi:hypothetical protein ADL26_20900, partial [Thermoactinomyces vulgaris]
VQVDPVVGEVGAAEVLPVGGRVRGRDEEAPARPEDAEDLAEQPGAIAQVVDDEGAQREVERGVGREVERPLQVVQPQFGPVADLLFRVGEEFGAAVDADDL